MFFFSGYVTDVLDDAKVYSSHGNKKNLDVDDVKLAIQCRMDQSFTAPPPRDVSIFFIGVMLLKVTETLVPRKCGYV